MPAIGWFAAISIEADNVILDLNQKSIEASQGFVNRNFSKIYSNIALNNAAFPPALGTPMRVFGYCGCPATTDLVPSFVTVDNVVIRNGTLGRSSGSGISGYDVDNLQVYDLVIRDFEAGGVVINGLDAGSFKDICISGNDHVRVCDVCASPVEIVAINSTLPPLLGYSGPFAGDTKYRIGAFILDWADAFSGGAYSPNPLIQAQVFAAAAWDSAFPDSPLSPPLPAPFVSAILTSNFGGFVATSAPLFGFGIRGFELHGLSGICYSGSCAFMKDNVVCGLHNAGAEGLVLEDIPNPEGAFTAVATRYEGADVQGIWLSFAQGCELERNYVSDLRSDNGSVFGHSVDNSKAIKVLNSCSRLCPEFPSKGIVLRGGPGCFKLEAVSVCNIKASPVELVAIQRKDTFEKLSTVGLYCWNWYDAFNQCGRFAPQLLLKAQVYLATLDGVDLPEGFADNLLSDHPSETVFLSQVQPVLGSGRLFCLDSLDGICGICVDSGECVQLKDCHVGHLVNSGALGKEVVDLPRGCAGRVPTGVVERRYEGNDVHAHNQ